MRKQIICALPTLGSLFTPLMCSEHPGSGSCRHVPACALSSAGGAPTCGADPLRAPRHGSQAAAANRKPAADVGRQGEFIEAEVGKRAKACSPNWSFRLGFVRSHVILVRRTRPQKSQHHVSLCHLLPAINTCLEMIDLALLWIKFGKRGCFPLSPPFPAGCALSWCSRPWCSRGSQRSVTPAGPGPETRTLVIRASLA